jgi:hypothetical protein
MTSEMNVPPCFNAREQGLWDRDRSLGCQGSSGFIQIQGHTEEYKVNRQHDYITP